MPDNVTPDDDANQYVAIRKKHFFIWLFILVICICIGMRALFLHGFYMGFVPPPEPAPPLSQELISRFIQLEDKLNKTINDVNEVYNFKEKLEKQLPPNNKISKVNDNKGGKYLPFNKFNLASEDYEPLNSFTKMTLALEQINEEVPFLKQQIASSILFQTNLPEGVPVIGKYMFSSGFGERIDPFTSQPSFHTGVDISSEIGTPVVAAAIGKVTKVNQKNDKTGYGNYIEITHPNNISTLYGHLSEILVKENQVLQKGEIIGLVGDSGRSTGPHLHFEVQVEGKAVDPMAIISPIAMKPNPISLSSISAEMKAKCAPLLAIVKDEAAIAYKECIANKDKHIKDSLLALQKDIPVARKPKSDKLQDGCTYVDNEMKLQTIQSAKCLNNLSSESSQ
jgi:murein DD-endopeptidase MepM/ murein hydrolase activator NlpD